MTFEGRGCNQTGVGGGGKRGLFHYEVWRFMSFVSDVQSKIVSKVQFLLKMTQFIWWGFNVESQNTTGQELFRSPFTLSVRGTSWCWNREVWTQQKLAFMYGYYSINMYTTCARTCFVDCAYSFKNIFLLFNLVCSHCSAHHICSWLVTLLTPCMTLWKGRYVCKIMK